MDGRAGCESLITFVSLISLMGRPGRAGEGKIRSDSSRSERTRSSTASAASLSGTRCSIPAFIRKPGLRHSLASEWTSSHFASRASPERHAVSTTNRRQAFADGEALEASMVSSEAATSR